MRHGQRARPVDERFVPTRSGAVHTVDIDGEAVLLDEATGRLHLLNVTGAFVWACLDGVSSLAEIVDDLSEELGVPRDRVAAESRSIIQQFAEQGLLLAETDGARTSPRGA